MINYKRTSYARVVTSDTYSFPAPFAVVCYLEDLIVEEAFRNQGFGKQLLDAVIEFAKSQKFKRVVWQVLDWNQPAIEFYKKYSVSFDDSWINVTLDLE